MTVTASDGSKSAESARLISVYRKRAKRYDRSAILLYLLGSGMRPIANERSDVSPSRLAIRWWTSVVALV